MSFTVNQIGLAAIAGTHGGTGLHQSTNWVVDPASVPGSGKLVFDGLDVEVTTMLFEIADPVVPNWFGVAVPRGLTDCTKAHIFFHPTPGQANYVDADYPTKSGKWPELFYYMERLGLQLDGARRGQVLIMPFMTEARKDAGILITDWQDIVTQILTLVRAQVNPGDVSPLSIAQLAVSSFSAGMVYSDAFRRNGAQVNDFLVEVWDFDGKFSTYHGITEALHSTAQVQVVKYDQVPSADTSAYHVPLGRWSDLVNPPTSNIEVHSLIRDFMFLDGASVSQVGSLLTDTGGTGTGAAGTHTATHAITATHTGSATQTAAGTATGSSTATDSASHSTTATATATSSGTTSGTASSATHSAGGTGSATNSTMTGTTAGVGTHTASASSTSTGSHAESGGTAPSGPGGSSSTGTTAEPADSGTGSPYTSSTPPVPTPANSGWAPAEAPAASTPEQSAQPSAPPLWSAEARAGVATAESTGCCPATPSIVALTAVTAQTSIAAIAALAAPRRKRPAP